MPRDAGISQVSQAVEERIEREVHHWSPNESDRGTLDTRVRALLAHPLSAGAVVQVALLHNRALQAAFADLGLARADLIQAGLIDNPEVSAVLGFDDRPGARTEIGLAVTQNLLLVLMRPGRMGAARARFKEARLRVAARVLDFAAGTRAAYYTLQGAQQLTAALGTTVEAAEVSYVFARKLHEAGNISDLDLATQQDIYERARIELARSEAQVLDARERLNVWMGLWGQDTQWKIPDRLPDLPAEEVPVEHLESLAVSRRLDLAAAQAAVEASARSLGLERSGRWLTGLQVGASAEREEGAWTVGPLVALDLPLFDRRQASVARGQAELDRDENLLAALAVEIRAEVRAARNRMLFARNLADHYRNVVIPLRERIVARTLEQYNYMLLGAFDLLVARQGEIDSYQGYVEAVRDYWIARSDLERAVGEGLPSEPLPAR